ncbi:glutamate racemase 2 [Clostridium tepidiprofundi DSM 19306]|uniref:Glutamate racemase n=1 Tax=Clostridium tepidiprofundi DSM 19306 TaxID=1121338 RepID=A0A151AYG2_9CLOT|nr:glutamate racemase [Clostridium tepidiprofundi]KYH32447.1 glutamate racemase 2 [Clostridium tepidiprofundi DSM 19306]
MNIDERPIGFFDSGVGGISVLREAVKLMPNENYIYFGDSKNAPYGTKSVEEIKKLSFDVVDFLIKKDIKALVVACNTATSAVIDELRLKYSNIPVIGIEPALKPAVEMNREGNIIIMATPVTLSEKKFNKLMKKYEKEVNIELLPCPGLVELIEMGFTRGDKINNYLKKKLGKHLNGDIAAIVLGCTHYPFVKYEIEEVVGSSIPILDGGIGTAKQLKRQIEIHNIENKSYKKGKVEIFNSLQDKKIIKLSYDLLTTRFCNE